MTPEQIVKALRENEDRRVRIVWDDGTVESVVIVSVDEEGLVHSGESGDPSDERNWFWTRLEHIVSIEAKAQSG
jgi:hypothetical protein